jgi:transcriptional regulator with XRE-family HTH domain
MRNFIWNTFERCFNCITFVTMEDVVRRIQEFMDQSGHNATTLAKAIGMNRPTLVHILNGRNKPNLQLLQQLALFDTSLDIRYLLTGELRELPQEVKTELTPTPSVHPATKSEEKLLVLNPNGTWNTYTKEA